MAGKFNNSHSFLNDKKEEAEAKEAKETKEVKEEKKEAEETKEDKGSIFSNKKEEKPAHQNIKDAKNNSSFGLNLRRNRK